MTVLLLAGLLAGVSIPVTTAPRARADAQGAARVLATRLRLARAQAVARGVNVGIQISDGGAGPLVDVFADGNGNGVRRAEILTGVDPRIDATVGLRELFPRVGLGAADGRLPPTGTRAAPELFSFSAAGTASSGTVYLQAGVSTQVAVRVLGATGRVRLLQRHPISGAWEEQP